MIACILAYADQRAAPMKVPTRGMERFRGLDRCLKDLCHRSAQWHPREYLTHAVEPANRADSAIEVREAQL